MIDKSIAEAQVQSEAEQEAARSRRRVRNVRTATIIAAFAVGVLVASGFAAVVWYYYPNHTTSSSSNQNPSPPSGPTPGTYWHNTSFTGEATDLSNVAWTDFNLSCPTGNMILRGVWFSGYVGLEGVLVNTSQYGGPAILQIISGGVTLATEGNQSAHELGQSTFGSFYLVVHQNVTFKVGYPASDSSAIDNPQWIPQVIITGAADSWSVIL